MRSLPPLNALKSFEASGRHLNFRLAADELGVTQGAVAQQVRGLEDLLGVKLFNRQPRGLALTDEGRSYLPTIRRAFDLINEATENLAPKEKVITISATPSFAARWLVPRLGQFAEDHPEIRLRLDASNHLANFQSDGVDIAIRQGWPPFGHGLQTERLFANELIPVCHPDLIGSGEPIEEPKDLLKHTLLEDAHGQWPLFLDTFLDHQPESSARMMRFSQTSLAIDAALAGQGIALISRALVASELAQYRLQQAIALSLPTQNGYFVVTPRTPRQKALTNLVRNWLMDQC